MRFLIAGLLAVVSAANHQATARSFVEHDEDTASRADHGERTQLP